MLVVALLAGTAAAFAITEGLKLEPAPIASTRVLYKVFSPVCRCDKQRTMVQFRLRKADRLTISIVDDDGDVVRELADHRPFPRGLVRVVWNGRDDASAVVADGAFRPRIRLEGERRTITLPSEIAVDTTRPTARVSALAPPTKTISPDGDRQADFLRVHYRMSEPARALLFANGKRRFYGRWARTAGYADWTAKHDGRVLPPGRYRVQLGAEDVAGNVSRSSAFAVRIRYVELGRRLIRVPARIRFGVRVLTDAPRYRWRLGKQRGSATGRLLIVRAPVKPGRYRLVVEASGHLAVARVVVSPRS